MLFNSMNFLLFFPVVALFHFVLPHKTRWVWLLVASYFFYMSWNPKYALLLSASILITWISGLALEHIHSNYNANTGGGGGGGGKKVVCAFSVSLNLAILIFFKYSNFVIESINRIIALFPAAHFSLINPEFDILLPVGISFYTFQALSYTMDVYRGAIHAEKNFAKYALFVSFFPQLVAGPIERSRNLLPQMRERHYFNWERVKSGLLLMLWGYFEKIVIADRAAILANQVFNNYQDYSGFQMIIAAIFFAFQIYGDFSGYSHIAIGAAEVMGFRLMKNFNQPYFAASIQDFWRRWHISLSSWFRDYLYIPLGGSRCSKLKHQFNIMLTFTVSGIWHGAGLRYIFWGALHGAYHVIGELGKPLREKTIKILQIRTETLSYRLFKIIITFILTCIAWILFRANSLEAAFNIYKQIIADFHPGIFFGGGFFDLGLNRIEFLTAILSISILLAADWVHYRNPDFSFRDALSRQNILARGAFYIIAIMSIFIFGAYGREVNPSAFIYFQF
jgi:D-alanyl-lipoteichoic acid acyltransferase DltB (MBOAT superfamily)